MIEQIQAPAPPVAEPSMADYKKARSEGKDVTATAPVVENPAASEPATPPAEPAAPGTAKEPIQDGQQHQKRDKTAAGRAKELIAEGRLEEAQSILDGAAKKDRERAEKAEQELRELRGRTPEPAKPAEPAKHQESKQEAKARKDFLADYFKNNPDAVYEDGLDAFDEVQKQSLFAEWDKRSEEKRQKETAEADAKKQTQAQQERMAKAKEKYSDYDDVIAAGRAATADVPANVGVSAAFNESEIVGELAYHFSANPEEFRRISALPPQAAYRAVIALEYKLSTPGSPAPVNPERPIIPPSAAPAPPAPTGGGFSGSSAKTVDKATSMAEHKKLRQG